MSSPTTQPNPSSTAQNPWRGQLAPLLQAIAPTGAAAAVLYYLGVMRNQSYFRYFGLDPNAVNLTVLQQITQSIEVVISVIGAGIVVLILHFIGSNIGKAVTNPSLSSGFRRNCLAGALLVAVVVFAILLIIGLTGKMKPAFLALPVGVGEMSSIAVIGMKVAAQSASAPFWLGLVDQTALKRLRFAVWVIIALAAIVTTSNYAKAVGRADAESIVANLQELPSVTLYTKQDLGLDGRPATLTSRSSQDATYKYSYPDFRVLCRTSDKWFLILTSWRPRFGRVYQIQDGPELRVEFIS